MSRSNTRYSRQTSLAEFGEIGQAKLASARVLIVGLGGLGVPVAQYLNAMGVGTLGLVEYDIVELHNLQRQVLYTEKDVGKSKLRVAVNRLKDQNTTTQFKIFPSLLNRENVLDILKDFDVIVDATDNFPTRYLINDACVLLKKPFVYGALHSFEGQVSVFNFKDGPTYRCLFPIQPSEFEIPNCDENGVLGVIPGIVGSLQALEVIKMITGIGETLSGKLMVYDGLSQQTRTIAFESIEANKNMEVLKDSYGTIQCPASQNITAEAFLQIGDVKQLIDVRTREEYEDNHIEGAINIPLSELKDRLPQIDYDIPIYLICQSGKRSEMAWNELSVAYPDASIFNILGGMNEISMEWH